MPVFTAWFDHLTFDKPSRMSKALVSDTNWQGSVGVRNQERWLKISEEQHGGDAAFFVIHAIDVDAEPRRIREIDADRIFVGKLVRHGTETYVLGQPRPL